MGLLFGVEIVIRMLPYALLSPIAGPVADRLPRRLLMVTADLLRAGVVLCYLSIDEPGELPWLYTLMVAQMSLAIFFDSARSASVPNTVPKEELHEAYALSAATWSTMLALGAAGSFAEEGNHEGHGQQPDAHQDMSGSHSGMGHGMGRKATGMGGSGMQHGMGMHDMHERMGALHDHSKMMEGITDQKKLAEEMKKHMRMMDEMMEQLMQRNMEPTHAPSETP